MLPTPKLRADAVAVAVRRFFVGLFWLWSNAWPLLVPGPAAVGFGGVLLLPYDTFATGPAFADMRDFAPEWAWGIFIAAGGAVHLVALAVFPNHHAWACLPLCGLFLSIAMMFCRSTGFASTGTPVYFILAVTAAWAAAARLDRHG
jgi:hypothetical protein